MGLLGRLVEGVVSPVLRHRSNLTGSEVWEGDAREVAAAMAPGSCSLAFVVDGWSILV